MNQTNPSISSFKRPFSTSFRELSKVKRTSRRNPFYVGKNRSSAQKRHNTRSVLGIDISLFTPEAFLKTIEHSFRASSLNQEDKLFIATVNPEFVIDAYYDAEFREILNQTHLNTADGAGICLALSGLYQIRQPRITGSDSTEQICKLAAIYHKRIFLLGAAEGIAEKAANHLKQRIPDLQIGGVYSPKNRMDSIEDYPPGVQKKLQQAEVLFVALGAPAQEKWISKHLQKLPQCRVAVGIGGTLDFIAGEVKRAPKWMQGFGVEWLYRLLKNPSRWRRMLKIPIFIYLVLKEWVQGHVLSLFHSNDRRSIEQPILWQIPLIHPISKRY